MHKSLFFRFCSRFPDILVQIKLGVSEYDDPWKKFKLLLLNQVEYFKKHKDIEGLLDEVQYNMEEEIFEKGAYLTSRDENCKALTFVVDGQIELLDGEGENERVIETLAQGDTIGQFSVLFDERLNFDSRAKTPMRVLTLSLDFFKDNYSIIYGLD